MADNKSHHNHKGDNIFHIHTFEYYQYIPDSKSQNRDFQNTSVYLLPKHQDMLCIELLQFSLHHAQYYLTEYIRNTQIFPNTMMGMSMH